MLDILLRPLKDIFISPFISVLAKFDMSPNVLTLTSGFFGLICIYYCYIREESLALAFYILNRIFDGLDGAYARATDKTSDFGGYLDILVDFTIYGLIPVAVAAAYPA